MASIQKEDKGGTYAWQRVDGPTEYCLAIVEQRREDILQQLPEGATDEDVQHIVATSNILREWAALIAERDRLVRKKVDEDNKETLDRCLYDVHQMLVVIGQLDHSHAPVPLKRALCVLYHELNNYQVENKQEPTSFTPPAAPTPPAISASFDISSIPPSAKKVKFDETETPISSRRKTPTIPHVPMSSTPKRRSIRAVNLRRSSLRTPKSGTPRTPRRGQEEDLRKLLLSGKEQLKSTPGVKRSPGGTPVREGRPLDLANPSDMVTLALQKKFKNVRRLYASPSQKYHENDSMSDFESSLHISID